MEPHIRSEMEDMIDCYFPIADLKNLLLECIRNKAEEPTFWSGITLHVHYMLGGGNPYMDRLAAITEMIVLALDMMDDLQDRDNPDKPWMKRPQELSLNAMTGLLMGALAALGACRRVDPAFQYPDASEVSAMIAAAINGQHMDLVGLVATEEQYVEMVRNKSGMLMRIAFYMGAGALHEAQLPNTRKEKLYELADHIGIVAQIRNDSSDILRTDLKNDLFAKKRTLPVLYLLASAESDFPLLHQYYVGELSFAELADRMDDCLAYIRESKCLSYCSFIENMQLNRAERLFEDLELLSPWKEKFRELTLDAFRR